LVLAGDGELLHGHVEHGLHQVGGRFGRLGWHTRPSSFSPTATEPTACSAWTTAVSVWSEASLGATFTLIPDPGAA
jgi:hypothetical protein